MKNNKKYKKLQRQLEINRSKSADILAMIRDRQNTPTPDRQELEKCFNNLDQGAQKKISKMVKQNPDYERQGFDSREEQIAHYIARFSENDKEPFHEFKELEIAQNSAGLYEYLMSRIDWMKDADEIKFTVKEDLLTVLSFVPDFVVKEISMKLHGLHSSN